MSFMSIATVVSAEERHDWDRHERHDREQWGNHPAPRFEYDRNRNQDRDSDYHAWFVFHPRYAYETHYVPSFGYQPWKSYACSGWEFSRYEMKYIRTCYEIF